MPYLQIRTGSEQRRDYRRLLVVRNYPVKRSHFVFVPFIRVGAGGKNGGHLIDGQGRKEVSPILIIFRVEDRTPSFVFQVLFMGLFFRVSCRDHESV